jgi:hypothetical protein
MVELRIRQTFRIGVALLAASILWFVGSILAVASFSSEPQVSEGAHAWVVLLPSVMLLLAAVGFLVTWATFYVNRALGLTATDDDPKS